MDDFIGVVILLSLYLLPTIVAVARRVPNTGSVVVVNVLLGVTVIGWIVALAMACRSGPATAGGNVNQSTNVIIGGQTVGPQLQVPQPHVMPQFEVPGVYPPAQPGVVLPAAQSGAIPATHRPSTPPPLEQPEPPPALDAPPARHRAGND